MFHTSRLINYDKEQEEAEKPELKCLTLWRAGRSEVRKP